MPPQPNQSTIELATRLGVSYLPLRVIDVATVGPSMRRIRLTADALADIEYEPGQDLMLSVDESGATRRRYTIRSFDRAARTVDVDVVLHGDGPGSTWARSATAGDTIDAIGPRGKVVLEPDAAWHLFVGDETFLPAAFAMVEALPATAAARVVLDVDGPADEQMPLTQADVEIVWLHRNGAEPGDPAVLGDAVVGLDLPAGTGHAYIGGELRAVNAARLALIARGFTPEQLSPKPYWRRGVANANHGEPPKD